MQPTLVDPGASRAETPSYLGEIFTFGSELANEVWLEGCPRVKRARPHDLGLAVPAGVGVGDGDLEITRGQNRGYALAEGFHRMTSKKSSNTWLLFLRYQAQTERLYRRALEDFERLKALRHELPNEPILEAQPEPSEATCDTLPTDPIPPEDTVLTPPAPPAPPVRFRDDLSVDPNPSAP